MHLVCGSGTDMSEEPMHSASRLPVASQAEGHSCGFKLRLMRGVPCECSGSRLLERCSPRPLKLKERGPLGLPDCTWRPYSSQRKEG